MKEATKEVRKAARTVARKQVRKEQIKEARKARKARKVARKESCHCGYTQSSCLTNARPNSLSSRAPLCRLQTNFHLFLYFSPLSLHICVPRKKPHTRNCWYLCVRNYNKFFPVQFGHSGSEHLKVLFNFFFSYH